jgi:cytochrome d ubiquinol oxidase subunit II
MSEWLPVAWFGVIAFGVMMYVLLDGFVLGLGILAAFARDEAQLDDMMNTAAPIWDGNETWLVLGGAGLMAAFPRAYAIILSNLYLPVLLMLIALVFRGVAFEFRFKAVRSKRHWGFAFAAGSILAAFAQGLMLGAIVQGLPADPHQARTSFAWFSPFAMTTGVALVFGYALLGASWLILKTEGNLRRRAREWIRPLIVAMLAFIGLVSSWLPFLDSRIMARWFEGNRFLWLSPMPMAVLVCAVMLWRAAAMRSHDARPFLLSYALFALGFVGLLIGLWPNIVPPSLSLWEASSPPSSQGFVFVGLVILLPVILGYTAWSYRVFRGKIEAGSGYH